MAWISWLLVCKPKYKGRLGIKHCERFNLSLLRKWKWHILDKPKVIWPTLLSMRCGDIKVKVIDENKQSLSKEDSLWWRDLSLVGFMRGKVCSWFSYNISCKLGNRRSVEFWNNKWLGHVPIRTLFPLIYVHAEHTKHKDEDVVFWEENKWIREVKVVENLLLQVEEKS
ncbi:unnamed protein product [Lathyrus sativus]|nr:unnamed protein product [Lathyrus sativus]